MLIKEFLPNPTDNDQQGEYIKIFNDGPKSVLLNGWSLKDASGKVYKLTGSISGDQELALPYSQTKISLNNNGEQIFLYDSAGKLADQLSYSGQANEGQIVQHQASGIKYQELKNEQTNFDSSITNYQLPITKIIFLDFLTAAILAGIGLYLILQIERKLDIKLF